MSKKCKIDLFVKNCQILTYSFSNKSVICLFRVLDSLEISLNLSFINNKLSDTGTVEIRFQSKMQKWWSMDQPQLAMPLMEIHFLCQW